MRLWSIHPKYLDSKGLVAVWREGLLAQKVLQGKTRGYSQHPQLERFKQHKNPQNAIATYLLAIVHEADNRGYSFDRAKILRTQHAAPISVSSGQLVFELEWLKEKLRKRAPQTYKNISAVSKPEPHPFITLHKGGKESWEK
jgi:hypothetical protein